MLISAAYDGPPYNPVVGSSIATMPMAGIRAGDPSTVRCGNCMSGASTGGISSNLLLGGGLAVVVGLLAWWSLSKK